MTIDLDKYSLRKSYIQKWYRSVGNKDISGTMSSMAAATLIPYIVIVFWVAEVEGWNEELTETANRLIEFYDYDEILNKPANCPI